MRGFSRFHSRNAFTFRNRIAAALALLVGLAVLPNRADAGCGDYVLIRGRHVAMDHGPVAPGSVSADKAASYIGFVDAADRDANPARPACRGPHCSDGSMPPSAPMPKINVSIDRWACQAGEYCPSLVSTSSLFAEPREFVAEAFGLSILRPPR
ncbi:MAG: hypothetical protein EXS05_01170 [Planctomycetaceae bacterium]|nr:hypothetical protein [Planctomycetaceae bacterium]